MKNYRIDKLHKILPKNSGRDVSGHISVRHQGGRHKRYFRTIDYLRDKIGVPGRVVSIEYDPNRTCDIALVSYVDGDKRYILSPIGLKLGMTVISGPDAEIKIGNALPLHKIPIGTQIHNLEYKPGKGGQIIRSAGTAAMLLSKDGEVCQIKLPSGEIRIFKSNCIATIGQLGNQDWKNTQIGKAGRSRHMGRRPTVRGVAQNPRSHPHGGGEGRSGIGMPSPKSPWGKRTLGKRTRKLVKYSTKFIVKRRNQK